MDHLAPPQENPRSQKPTAGSLKQQQAAKAAAGPGKPKIQGVKLTPEQQAKKNAEEAEKKAKEQVKIVAINDEWKAKLTTGEQDEVLRAASHNGKGLVINDVIQPCGRVTRPKVLNCLPGDKTLLIDTSQEMADAVIKSQEEKRKTAGTKVKIDYVQVSKWEGGSFTGGYVPWGPVLVATKKDIGEKGKPHNVTIFVPDVTKTTAPGQKTPKMRGMPKNNSGVTIGAGVDLGSKDDTTQRQSIKRSAKGSGLMTDAEADALADKLKPYYGLKRTEACQYLREHPLNLSRKEIEVLNYESFMTHTDGVIRQYQEVTDKKWTDLTEQEQTYLFSHHYHKGNVLTVSTDVGNYEPDKVLKYLGPKEVMKKGKLVKIKEEREYYYMKAFYEREAAAGTPRAKAYAVRKAARAAAKVPKAVVDSVKVGH